MKTTLLYCFIILFLSCGNSSFEKVPNQKIDKVRLELATKLTTKILTAQKNGSYYKLNATEATIAMLEGLDANTQINAYQQIKGLFGDYEQITFHEMLKYKDGTLLEVYRFKGKFSSNAKVEVRTVLDGNGKLAGFFVTYWKDKI